MTIINPMTTNIVSRPAVMKSDFFRNELFSNMTDSSDVMSMSPLAGDSLLLLASVIVSGFPLVSTLTNIVLPLASFILVRL